MSCFFVEWLFFVPSVSYRRRFCNESEYVSIDALLNLSGLLPVQYEYEV